MLGSLKKKNRAIGTWHNRAMLIDFKKTKLTIIHVETATPIQTFCNAEPTDFQVVVCTENLSDNDFEEETENSDEVSGVPVSFVPVECGVNQV